MQTGSRRSRLTKTGTDPAPLRVLIIDDNPYDRQLVVEELRKSFSNLQTTEIADRAALEQSLAAGDFDAVITDYSIGWTDGLEVVRAVKARYPRCPVIMHTGTGNEAVAVEAMKAGLDDYVLKTAKRSVRLRAAIDASLARYEQRAAAEDAEARYRTLFEGVPVGLFRVTAQGEFLDVNPAHVQLLGYASRDAFMSVNSADLYIEPESRLEWLSLVEQQGTVQGFETQMRRQDGGVIWVRLNARAVVDPDGTAVHYEGSLEDVTARRQARELLKESEEKHRQLVEHIPDVAWTSDDNGNTVLISPNVTRIYGFTPEELYREGERLWMGRIHPDDLLMVKSAYQSLFETNRIFDVEYRIQRKDGEWIWIHDRAVATYERAGVHYAHGLFTDVTERRELEAQLLRAQRMEAVGRLAGEVAHDFNNLLASITGHAQLVLYRLRPDDSARNELNKIVEAAEDAASLIRKLVAALSRRQMLELENLDLNALVAGFEKVLIRIFGKKARVILALAPSLGSVRADPAQLKQMVVNLALNARDAMPEGGTFTITTEAVDLIDNSVHRYRVSRPGPHVLISFTDTGSGMDSETLAKIFEPFFTTKTEGRGLGLGLTSVYGMVRQSGGGIWVDSEPGRGTTFKIYLPVGG